MTHIDHRSALLILLPLVLVFLAGLAAGVAAIFLVCNISLLHRIWERAQVVSFALSVALSLSLSVLIGSVLSGLLLKLGIFGDEVYVPESFPVFLLRPALEFFVIMLAALVVAVFAFGFVRHSSELVQRIVVPLAFLVAFIVALSLAKTWSSYLILASQFDTETFAGTLYKMISSEFAGIFSSLAGIGDALARHQGGTFSRLFQMIGGEIDSLWVMVRNAGGNQFVLVESFPVIFAVSSLVSLVYMVLRWPFTAFAHAKDDT
ncbi:hypothetical protein [Breoghania sp.]|uniref:hypothetical protein n=1 Tax=Breoghania sp. TaxID=2065378 RepID=UPI0029C9FE37|nr:hypothetical protein [Breoghania sp.]